VSDSRRVAFSIPFATRWDFPSGATSERLTAKPITDAVDFYTFSTVTRRKSTAWLTYRLPASNNNVPAVTPEGYTPKLFINDADFQTVAGFEGTSLFGTGISWDLSTSLARDNVAYHESSLNASLGAASPTYFYLGKLVSQEWTNNFDLTKEVQLGAFSKPLFVVAGLEYRKNKYEIGLGDPAPNITRTPHVPGRRVGPDRTSVREPA